jgi:hypothetical protein
LGWGEGDGDWAGGDWENPVTYKTTVKRVMKEALIMQHRLNSGRRDGSILSKRIDLTATLPMQKRSIPRVEHDITLKKRVWNSSLW